MRAKVFVVISGSLLLSGCNPLESKLISACESVFKERLRSPSGYQRVKVDEYRTEISGDEWLENANARETAIVGANQITADAIVKYGWQPAVYRVFVEHDTPNAFGTPIRGTFMCEFYSYDGTMDDLSERWVQVDGFTHHDWEMEQIRSLSR